jgi:hypothetical protein
VFHEANTPGGSSHKLFVDRHQGTATHCAATLTTGSDPDEPGAIKLEWLSG